MSFEPKDLIAIYAAVVATINIGWSVWAHIRDQRRNQTLESQESLRTLSVKHIRFTQTVHEIRRMQRNLDSKIQVSDVSARLRLDEIGKFFPKVDIWYFNDRARVEQEKQVIDKLKLEPMHKRIDELLAHVDHMQTRLLEFQEQHGLNSPTDALHRVASQPNLMNDCSQAETDFHAAFRLTVSDPENPT